MPTTASFNNQRGQPEGLFAIRYAFLKGLATASRREGQQSYPNRRIPSLPYMVQLMARKVAAMAEAVESTALDQMTMDASRALRDGVVPRRIVRQMGL